MSETTNTEYQKREVVRTYAFMTFAQEFGMQLNTAEFPKKDGDTFKCAAFTKRKDDGDIVTTYVDFTKECGEMTVSQMIKDRDNLRILALDYSDDEHPELIRYKLCRSRVKLNDDTFDLSSL